MSTVSLKEGFAYQDYSFWNSAIEMIAVESRVREIEYECSVSLPYDDFIVRFWESQKCTSPLEYTNRDFYQCKYAMGIKSKVLTWEKLIDPKHYGNKESFLARAFCLYRKEKQVDNYFRLILLTTANFDTKDLLWKFINQGSEGNIEIQKFFENSSTADMRSQIKSHIESSFKKTQLQILEDEFKDFLIHLRFDTGIRMDKQKSDLKKWCDAAKIKFDTSCRSDRFGSLIGDLHKDKLENQEPIKFNRIQLLEILKADKMLTDDLEYWIYDKKFWEAKDEYFSIKVLIEKSRRGDNGSAVLNREWWATKRKYEELVTRIQEQRNWMRDVVKLYVPDGVDKDKDFVHGLAKDGEFEEFIYFYSEANRAVELYESAKKGKEEFVDKNRKIFAEFPKYISVGMLKSEINWGEIDILYKRGLEVLEFAELPEEDFAFRYAKFLKSCNKDSDALSAVESYLKNVKQSEPVLTTIAEAHLFALILQNKLESQYDMIVESWSSAIDIWKRIIKTKIVNQRHECEERLSNETLRNLQSFLRNVAECIISIKDYPGAEDFVGIKGLAEGFYRLTHIFEAVVRTHDMQLDLPKGVSKKFKDNASNLLRKASIKVAMTTEEIAENYDDFAIWQPISPHIQSELALLFAYMISKFLVLGGRECKDDLIELSKNCISLGSLIMHRIPKDAYCLFSFATKSFDGVGSIEDKREIATIWMRMGTALLVQDAQSKDSKNNEKAKKLNLQAIELLERMFEVAPAIFYAEMFSAYISEARRIEYYARIDNEYDIAEMRYLDKALASGVIAIENDNYSIDFACELAETLRRQFFLCNPSIFDISKNIDKNFEFLIEFCETNSEKYPLTFLPKLFDTYRDRCWVLFGQQNFVGMSQTLEKAARIALKMVQQDHSEYYYACGLLFKEFFNGELEQEVERGKIPKEILDIVLSFEEKILREMIETLGNKGQAWWIPAGERYARWNSDNIERDDKFIDKFESVIFKAANRLTAILVGQGRKNDAKEFLGNLVAIYEKQIDTAFEKEYPKNNMGLKRHQYIVNQFTNENRYVII